MPQGDRHSLWDCLNSQKDTPGGFLLSAHGHVGLSDLASGSGLGGRGEELRGRSVLIATEDQLAAALALIELDGVAHRLVVCPPDLRGQDRGSIMAIASADAIVSDRELAQAGASSTSVVRCGARVEPSDRRRPAS